jgi:hypothetical protein
MSYETSFADVLALGDSDGEDPIFEIDKKQKKKAMHKKMMSDVFTVRNSSILLLFTQIHLEA